jgi:hypothetical protein
MRSAILEDAAMKERTTQYLLATVIVLLVAQLFRVTLVPAADAKEAEQVASVLRAREILLVDEAGKTVAQLHVGADGGGNLRLRSGDGMVRVKLGATADGSGLLLFDREAEPAVSLASNKSGTTATLAEKGKDKKVIKP